MIIDVTTCIDKQKNLLNTETGFSWYEDYCMRQKCYKCGAKFSERPKDKDGNYIDLWVHEDWCGCK